MSQLVVQHNTYCKGCLQGSRQLRQYAWWGERGTRSSDIVGSIPEGRQPPCSVRFMIDGARDQQNKNKTLRPIRQPKINLNSPVACTRASREGKDAHGRRNGARPTEKGARTRQRARKIPSPEGTSSGDKLLFNRVSLILLLTSSAEWLRLL